MLPIVFMDLIDESDIPAFEKMYEANKALAYSRAYRILQNSAIAEECVSDTFFALARIFQRVKQLNEDEQRRYIVISVRNRAYSIIAKEHNPQESLEYIDTVLSKDIYNDIGVIELKELIKKLSNTDSEIIYLVSVLGMSYKEIADSYGINYSAVKQRFFAAKKNLAKLLSEEAERN